MNAILDNIFAIAGVVRGQDGRWTFDNSASNESDTSDEITAGSTGDGMSLHPEVNSQNERLNDKQIILPVDRHAQVGEPPHNCADTNTHHDMNSRHPSSSNIEVLGDTSGDNNDYSTNNNNSNSKKKRKSGTKKKRPSGSGSSQSNFTAEEVVLNIAATTSSSSSSFPPPPLSSPASLSSRRVRWGYVDEVQFERIISCCAVPNNGSAPLLA